MSRDGVALALIVVVVDAASRTYDGGFAVWFLLLVLFVASVVHGTRQAAGK
jgi:hypothetical protein